MMFDIPVHVIELDPGSYHLYVTLHIGNQLFNFIIDTGASQSVLDYRHKLLLKKDKEQRALHTTESGFSINSEIIEYGKGTIPKVYSEKNKIKNLKVTLIDLNYINELYRKYTDVLIDGLLGCDFLLNYGAIIDINEKKITLCNA